MHCIFFLTLNSFFEIFFVWENTYLILLFFIRFFLYPEEQKRISLVKNIEEADYIITVYNGYVRRKDIINDKFKIFNEIKSGDAIINSTFIK